MGLLRSEAYNITMLITAQCTIVSLLSRMIIFGYRVLHTFLQSQVWCACCVVSTTIFWMLQPW